VKLVGVAGLVSKPDIRLDKPVSMPISGRTSYFYLTSLTSLLSYITNLQSSLKIKKGVIKSSRKGMVTPKVKTKNRQN